MRAVILAGGKGTRLRPYTTIIPKPLVPVGDRSILEILLRRLKVAGVTRATIAVNHLADLIMAFFGTGEKVGIKLDYSFEDVPLGTVGPLKMISDLPDCFLVLNGDLLTDLDCADLYRAHVAAGTELTVATYRRSVKIDFGVLESDQRTGLVTGFKEKPELHYDVSMGAYVFSRKVLERVPAGQPYGFDDLVLGLLKDGCPIKTYPFGGYWLDIGRPDDYEQANLDVERLGFLKE